MVGIAVVALPIGFILGHEEVGRATRLRLQERVGHADGGSGNCRLV